jgi:aldose 1-epimerase
MATTTIRPFGRLEDGREVDALTLASSRGIEATLLTLGATVQSLLVPDAHGDRADVVLGFDRAADYLSNGHYFGCTVGRHANRIARGRFSLDGRQYQLECNDGENHLHGGITAAFHRQLWRIERAASGQAVLALCSEDGAGGYPGQVEVTATFTLDDQGRLGIEYRAVTDAPTIINLTHHGYFNLASRGDVTGHRLTLHASRFASIDGGLIPDGGLPEVAGTPFDFRAGELVGSRLHAPHEQLRIAGGYDHHFVVDGEPGRLRPAAKLADPASGRVLELHSTAPGLQFYSGNFLDGSVTGKGGVAYHRHAGLCLEPQGYPDAPNQPAFPGTRLLPGDAYTNHIVLHFGHE